MEKQTADRLIVEYLQKIYGFAMTHTFSYDEAEELSSEIVCELYVSLLAADEVYNPDGYVWRIARHVYAKFVSSRKKHVGISIDGIDIAYEQNFADDGREDELRRLRREVAFLTESRRRIVYAHYFEGRTVDAIAAQLSLPEGTVKWHLSKARDELRKGINMERKIGNLGLHPYEATNFNHGGSVGERGGPEAYLGDRLSLNIVYSCYHEPRTKTQIAEELGVTPVFIEDRIATLEENGFLVPTAGKRYTTYVMFDAPTYSREALEVQTKARLEIASMLLRDYVGAVREAVAHVDVFVPSENRELFEAAAIFCAVANKTNFETKVDASKYLIKTTDGGEFFAWIQTKREARDPDFVPTLAEKNYNYCGSMNRWSEKYPVSSWSIDTRYSTRVGHWMNNLTSDYEALYEHICGTISDTSANAEKYARLRERGFIDGDGRVKIMVARSTLWDFFDALPTPDDATMRRIVELALEDAERKALDYPAHMKDLIMSEAGYFAASGSVALMVLDELYDSGAFRAMTEDERVTSQLLMFSDRLPE